jgi:hypothetical protein
MTKTILGILTALALLTSTLTAQEPSKNPTLPNLGPPYVWQTMPMICAPENTIHNDLTRQGFKPVNISLGRKDAHPEGEPVFMITYYVSTNGFSTAATMNIPTSDDTCLLYVTHNLVIVD